MINHIHESKSKTPELLAPAGSFEAVCAAIYAGCDAVYFGGKILNARINASNFEHYEMKKAADLCRLFGVKIYITMNTLIYDREFKKALEYAEKLIETISPDAFIIQDIGFAATLHKLYPNMPLHASTQMRLHSTDAVPLLKEYGFTRIVIAREMNLREIKAAVSSGVEIEMFIHGALCVSQSGGCLMSSMIGKRSGNRGECAQPCRLPFKTPNRYPLSLKDLCLATDIPALIDTGVRSLKIEGRMKNPDYVFGVVSIYRKLLNERRAATKSELQELDSLFSRQGFTNGYLHSKLGLDMFGYRTSSDKADTLRKKKDISYYDILLKQKSTKSKTLNKTSQLNYKKSDFILDEVNYKKPLDYNILRFFGTIPKNLSVPVNTLFIDIPIWRISEVPDNYFNNYTIRAFMPFVCSETDKLQIESLLDIANKKGVKDILITNISQLRMSALTEFILYGDFALNATNEYTLQFFKDKLKSITLSPELSFPALKNMKKPLLCDLVVYGKLPLMHTENCIIENMSSRKCDRTKKSCRSTLTDRKGAKFPILRELNHRNNIFNSVPIYLLDKKKELKQSGISGKVYLFSDENITEINNILKDGIKSNPPKPPFTRGYF